MEPSGMVKLSCDMAVTSYDAADGAAPGGLWVENSENLPCGLAYIGCIPEVYILHNTLTGTLRPEPHLRLPVLEPINQQPTLGVSWTSPKRRTVLIPPHTDGDSS